VADGGGLENRYGARVSSWVRIPHPPPSLPDPAHLALLRITGLPVFP
jgi:hypothetical protein